MADLIDAADCAYPPPAHLGWPATVRVVCGYLGGDTPHVWTPQEVAAVTVTGRLWCGIWTAPSRGQHLVAATGTADGAGAAQQLAALRIDPALPVFYDIEQGTYAASPSGALAALAAFKAILAGHGYRHVYGYLPWSAQRDWVANWTGARPTSLPAGTVGWQWSGSVAGIPYDRSVFDPALFPMITTPGGSAVATLDNDDRTWIDSQLRSWFSDLSLKLSAYVNDNQPAAPQPFALRHLSTQLAAVQAKIGALSTGSTDVTALAQALAADLGPDLGKQLVTALASALST